MARQLITTIGLSLLTNRDGRPWSGWNVRENSPLPQAKTVDEWLAQASRSQASAEINTWQALEISEADSVILLPSDTPPCRFCSDRLKHFLDHSVKSREVKSWPVIALGNTSTSFAQQGLKALINKAIEAYKEAQNKNRQPVFCTTGGFKAEIAFLNLLGALLGVEVCYIHETFSEIIRLPRLPLAWDTEWLNQHRNFFEWIDDPEIEPRRSGEVKSWLSRHPELQALVEEDQDGYSYLTVAGNLLFKAAKERDDLEPRALWPACDARPPKDKCGLSEVEHHRPPNWRQFVYQLCRIDCVRRVSYDKSAQAGQQVAINDPAQGTIHVRYERRGQQLPLRVETTAKGEKQTQLVADYIKSILK